ncbi:peptide methionine sulfoxide reductase [Nannochloropsis oceanica]
MPPSTPQHLLLLTQAAVLLLLFPSALAFLRIPSSTPTSSTACRSFSLSNKALGAAVARAGNVLTVDLSITLEDGTDMPADFDMGKNVRFRLGHGGLPPFVHSAVDGMVEKESKTVVVPPDEAYGAYYPELAAEIPAENAPRGLKVGDKVKLTNGLTARVTAQDTGKNTFTIDGNHPCGGRSLTLATTLQLVESAESQCFATAHLAAGCFWGLELAMQRLPGVVATAAGYTQGGKRGGREGGMEGGRAPTYSEVCYGKTGFVEAVEVLFDQRVISYHRILEVFWKRHDPTQADGQGNDIGTQYRGGIYYTSEEQRKVAEESKARVEASGEYDEPIVTEILPADTFFKAEEYHLQ